LTFHQAAILIFFQLHVPPIHFELPALSEKQWFFNLLDLPATAKSQSPIACLIILILCIIIKCRITPRQSRLTHLRKGARIPKPRAYYSIFNAQISDRQRKTKGKTKMPHQTI